MLAARRHAPARWRRTPGKEVGPARGSVGRKTAIGGHDGRHQGLRLPCRGVGDGLEDCLRIAPGEVDVVGHDGVDAVGHFVGRDRDDHELRRLLQLGQAARRAHRAHDAAGPIDGRGQSSQPAGEDSPQDRAAQAARSTRRAHDRERGGSEDRSQRGHHAAVVARVDALQHGLVEADVQRHGELAVCALASHVEARALEDGQHPRVPLHHLGVEAIDRAQPRSPRAAPATASRRRVPGSPPRPRTPPRRCRARVGRRSRQPPRRDRPGGRSGPPGRRPRRSRSPAAAASVRP